MRGADVTGIDIASNLVAAGNRRAAEAGLENLKFQEGDASNLEGVADDSFDLTLSMFGAMFAPRPHDVAKEMVRVTKPGGRVVMGNWIPGHPTYVAQVLKISSAYTPPPPEGFVSPMMWGVEQHIVERFGQAGVAREKISLAEDTFVFRSPEKSPEEVIDAFRRYYGPTMNAYDAAEKNGKVKTICIASWWNWRRRRIRVRMAGHRFRLRLCGLKSGCDGEGGGGGEKVALGAPFFFFFFFFPRSPCRRDENWCRHGVPPLPLIRP